MGTNRYIVWVGELAWEILRSGRSCYLFDESGALIQWSIETGDGHRLTEFVRAAYAAKRSSLKEALEFAALNREKESSTWELFLN